MVGVWLRASGERWLDAEAYRLAASLSFYALSSVFPLMLVVFGVGAAVLGDATNLRMEFISMLNATHSDATRELLEGTLAGSSSANETRSHWSVFAGVAGALIGASGLFLELDAAFSKLFRVPTEQGSLFGAVKRLLRDRASALILVIGTSVCLLVNTVVLGAVEVVVSHLPEAGAWLPWTLTTGVTLSLTLLPLMLCYKFVPDVRVSYRAALLGSIVSTLALYAVRRPFTWAVSHLTNYAAYGVVGTLLLLLTWIYLAGVILLFGAACTAISNETRSEPKPRVPAKV